MRRTLSLSCAVSASPDLKQKARIVSAVNNISLSDTELSVLTLLIEFSGNGTITLTGEISKQIRAITNVKEGAYNTAILRLGEKKAITKKGRDIILHPHFKDLEGITEVLVRF